MILYWILRSGRRIYWQIYPSTHPGEDIWDVLVRIGIAWIFLVFLTAVLGLGLATFILLFTPLYLLVVLLVNSPKIIGVLSLSERAGVGPELPDWFPLVRAVSLPIGFIQDLAVLENLLDGVRRNAGRIDWSKALNLVLSVAIKVGGFIKRFSADSAVPPRSTTGGNHSDEKTRSVWLPPPTPQPSPL